MSHLIMFYIKLTYIIGTVWEPSCKPSYHEMKLFYGNPSMGEIPKHKQSNQSTVGVAQHSITVGIFLKSRLVS